MKKILFIFVIMSIVSIFGMEESEPLYARGKEHDLFLAIEFNDIENVKQLINQGVDVDIRRIYNGKSQEPLHFAVDKKSYEIIPLLCTALMSPHEKKFFKAVETNKIDKVKNLIIHKKRFPPDHTNKVGDTALTIAVKKNYYDMVKALLQIGFDIHKTNKMGQTALTLAINAKNSAMVELLHTTIKPLNIDKQDEDGNTALMLAVKSEDKDVLKTILAEVPDYSLRNYDNKSALNFAVEIEGDDLKNEICELLYAARPQFNLYKAITLSESSDYIKQFITPDVLFSIKSIERNPFAAAIRMNNMAAFKVFIELTDVNQTLQHNLTPLMVAVENNRVAIVNILLQKRADINACELYCGLTPIFFTFNNDDKFQSSRSLIRKLLVENGANVNHAISLSFIGEPDNITPLMAAANRSPASVVKELIALRANPFLKNSEGRTALAIAKQNFKKSSYPPVIAQYGEIISTLEENMRHQSSFISDIT